MTLTTTLYRHSEAGKRKIQQIKKTANQRRPGAVYLASLSAAGIRDTFGTHFRTRQRQRINISTMSADDLVGVEEATLVSESGAANVTDDCEVHV